MIVGGADETLIGEKLFICDNQYYYTNHAHKHVFQTILNELSTIEKPQIYVLQNGIEVFVEILTEKPTLVLCGAGHVSKCVYDIGIYLGFDIVVIDDRESFANAERFPKAKEIICADFESTMKSIDYGSNAYYIIASRGHQYDSMCLKEILPKNKAYVGMIGSNEKIAVVRNFLLEKEFTDEQIQTVHTPIGLKISAQTPEEIAISILAEVISIKNKTHHVSCIDDEVFDAIALSSEPIAFSIILHKTGSIPREAGSKMVIQKDGKTFGSIGGGLIEHQVKLKGMDMIASPQTPILKTFQMDNTDAQKAGMACGGSAVVYIETIQPI